MKKIVFVERQQNSTYDPVSTFFAKNTTKSNSLAKGQVNPQGIAKQNPPKQQSIERPPSTKVPSTVQIPSKKAEQRQKPITNKIGRKGDHLPPKRSDVQTNKKQESVYGLGAGLASKKNIPSSKNQPVHNETQQVTQKIGKRVTKQQSYQQKQECILPQVNQRKSPNKQNQYNVQNKQLGYNTNSNKNTNSIRSIQNIHKNQNNEQRQQIGLLNNQMQSLRRRVKQLQQAQSHNQEFQYELQQKYNKLQQKFNKLNKQHKLCSTNNSQNNKKLKQRQQEMKKLLSKQQVPYSKKRQIMLQNQITNLKKINRQLVTRIKSYKGTDLVQVSMMSNKTDILFKQYDHVAPEQDGQQSNINTSSINLCKIQSLVNGLLNQLQSYLNRKASNKQTVFTQQKKLLVNIINQCKNISLQCMVIDQDFKIPSSNKQTINIYNQIEKYKSSMDPLIDKYDLNFIITEENIEMINNINQALSYSSQFKQAFTRKWAQQPKKFKKIAEASSYYLSKYKRQSIIDEQATNWAYILLAHCLSQISYIQAWFNKASLGLRQELNNLNIRLKQIEELSSLGQTGKQSLCLYVRTNIQQMLIRVPSLQLRLKEVGTIFKNVKLAENVNITNK